MAVATSAPYFSMKRFRHRRVSPLVDPRSQRPWVTPRSVSVMAPSCTLADALTKAVLFSKRFPEQVLARFCATAVIL